MLSEDRYADADERIYGDVIGLPLVAWVSNIRKHEASRVSWHEHPGFELLFVINGSTTYKFQDGATVRLSGYQFLVIPPRDMHCGQDDIRMPSTLCGIRLAPPPKRWPAHADFTCDQWSRILERLQACPRVVRPIPKFLHSVVSEMAREIDFFRSGQTDELRKVNLRLLSSMAMLQAARQIEAVPQESSDYLVAAAKKFLHERYQESPSLAELSRHLGITRAYLHQIFKQATGLTPHDFLNRYRMEEARKLLAESKGSLLDIGLELGFSSSQHFSSTFRRYLGQTPGEFRRKHAQ